MSLFIQLVIGCHTLTHTHMIVSLYTRDPEADDVHDETISTDVCLSTRYIGVFVCVVSESVGAHVLKTFK